MCENLHYESLYVYFKELHNDQEYYWPTIYKAGEAAVSAITNYWDYWSSDHSFQVYYKVRQLTIISLQSATCVITKYGKYHKVRQFYYKVR